MKRRLVFGWWAVILATDLVNTRRVFNYSNSEREKDE